MSKKIIQFFNTEAHVITPKHNSADRIHSYDMVLFNGEEVLTFSQDSPPDFIVEFRKNKKGEWTVCTNRTDKNEFPITGMLVFSTETNSEMKNPRGLLVLQNPKEEPVSFFWDSYGIGAEILMPVIQIITRATDSKVSNYLNDHEENLRIESSVELL